MERKIGEVFTIPTENGEIELKVTNQSNDYIGCIDCYFHVCLNKYFNATTGSCASAMRSDKTGIIFKLNTK